MISSPVAGGDLGLRDPDPDGPPALRVDGLTVELSRDGEWVRVVDGVGLDLRKGETLGLVGESGSGKTVTALALMGLLGSRSRTTGRVLLDGVDLLTLGKQEMNRIRGRDVAMVFQEPVRSLNPAFTVGDQVAEVLRKHRGLARRAAWREAVRMLDLVGIAGAERRARDHPHQFSGGMCQRVMLAMALACEPQVLIADEPTTALDVTVQAQILELMRELQDRTGVAILLITHDLGVVAEMCERVAVMYAGEVVETGAADALFPTPRHPYTAGLLSSLPDLASRTFPSVPGSVPLPGAWPPACRFAPRCPHCRPQPCEEARPPLLLLPSGAASRCARVEELDLPGIGHRPGTGEPAPPGPDPGPPGADPAPPLLVATGLTRRFVTRRDVLGRPVDHLVAVDDISLAIRPGQTLAVVGESGSGKSTLGRLLLRLDEADAGTITFAGEDLRAKGRRELRAWRKEAQVIFQDPYSSLDPRMTVGASLDEVVKLHFPAATDGAERRTTMLGRVGLDPGLARRYPSELSGGQLQRVAIARALLAEPALIVCDEPVTALDLSVRAQVLNLLSSIQEERGIALLFISHDLSVVRALADDVIVMHGGRIVEEGPAEALFAAPRDPYTRKLLSAVPVPDPARRRHRRGS